MKLVVIATLLAGCVAGAHAQRASSDSSRTRDDRGRGDAQNARQDDRATDTAITRAVEKRLARADGLAAHLIDVQARNGIVTLSGTVDHLLARERAADIALALRGVTAVDNRISVKAISRSDREIREDVKRALLLDPATESYEINVSANDGAVTLKGNVQSWQEQELALRTAKGVRGVKSVEDQIRVNYKENRRDSEIAADIRGRLRADARVDEDAIRAEVEDGTATLSGTANSGIERKVAIADAWVLGVNEVKADQLKVRPPLPGPLQNQTTTRGRSTEEAQGATGRQSQRGTEATGRSTGGRSDEQLEQDIRMAFLHNPRVLHFNPVIEVQDGVVTLSGTVSNLRAKQAAEADARNIEGVRQVKNFLKVRSANRPSDDQLANRVKNALLRHPSVSGFEIGVKSVNGRVRLSGEVDSHFEKATAEDVASSVAGVVAIQNRLRVWPEYEPGLYPGSYTPPPVKTDREIKEDIEDQLFWSLFVDKAEVNVHVRDGVATLTGSVDDLAEYNSATENALEGGAVRVHNNLKVDGGDDFGLPEK